MWRHTETDYAASAGGSGSSLDSMWTSLGGGGVGFWPVMPGVAVSLAVWTLLLGMAAMTVSTNEA